MWNHTFLAGLQSNFGYGSMMSVSLFVNISINFVNVYIKVLELALQWGLTVFSGFLFISWGVNFPWILWSLSVRNLIKYCFNNILSVCVIVEFVLNPMGKSFVCILHEYAQHTLKVQPKYVFRELGECTSFWSFEVSVVKKYITFHEWVFTKNNKAPANCRCLIVIGLSVHVYVCPWG